MLGAAAVASQVVPLAAGTLGLLGLGAGDMAAQELCAGPFWCRGPGAECCRIGYDTTRGFFCPC